jgi:hypothetical protein
MYLQRFRQFTYTDRNRQGIEECMGGNNEKESKNAEDSRVFQ